MNYVLRNFGCFTSIFVIFFLTFEIVLPDVEHGLSEEFEVL